MHGPLLRRLGGELPLVASLGDDVQHVRVGHAPRDRGGFRVDDRTGRRPDAVAVIRAIRSSALEPRV